jgi:hypothetical protein
LRVCSTKAGRCNRTFLLLLLCLVSRREAIGGRFFWRLVCELLLVTLRALMARVPSQPFCFLFVSGEEARVFENGFRRLFS